tara:strand:- start:795 stop:1247 length:453 start_codon:yes stop_codon:yes gene_type:complete
MARLNKNLLPQDASACVITAENGRLLMQLRDDRQDIFFPGRWGLFGGAIEDGESPLEAIKREIWEELSVDFDYERFSSCGEIKLVNDKHKVTRYFFTLEISELEIKEMVVTEGKGWDFLSYGCMNEIRMVPYDEYFLRLTSNHLYNDQRS